MYCDECKKNLATVHVTKIINGKKFEGHLCAECAQKDQIKGFENVSFAIPNFLTALFNLTPELEQPVVKDEVTCDNCGLSFEQVTKLGRLGCNECYTKFADKLEPLLRRIQGSGQHLGKVPLRRGGSIRRRKELNDLRTRLQQAVAREEFEQAASIRDQIRQLEQSSQE
ncbi:MAG TPA: UvrB/UvrC motif-containing protein [Desulfobacteria bacterium]|nr:UvrB/UvrC motif-containing protein [Desulfobacteria bacterium]